MINWYQNIAYKTAVQSVLLLSDAENIDGKVFAKR